MNKNTINLIKNKTPFNPLWENVKQGIINKHNDNTFDNLFSSNVTYKEFVEIIETEKIKTSDVNILFEPLLHDGLYNFANQVAEKKTTEENINLLKEKIRFLIYSPLTDINALDFNDDTPLMITCYTTSLTWAFEEILSARNKDVNILLRNGQNHTIVEIIETKQDVDKVNILNTYLGIDMEKINTKEYGKGILINNDHINDKERKSYIETNILRIKRKIADITNFAITEMLNK